MDQNNNPYDRGAQQNQSHIRGGTGENVFNSISSPSHESYEERGVYKNFVNSILQQSPPKRQQKGAVGLKNQVNTQTLHPASAMGQSRPLVPGNPSSSLMFDGHSNPYDFNQSGFDQPNFHSGYYDPFGNSQGPHQHYMPPQSTFPHYSSQYQGNTGGYQSGGNLMNSNIAPMLPDDLFLNDITTPQPQMIFNFQEQKMGKKYPRDFGIFESSNNEDDDDEDYSLHEDIMKNFKRYKNDEDLKHKTRFNVPKKEVDQLLADQQKILNEEEAQTPFNGFSANLQNQQSRKRNLTQAEPTSSKQQYYEGSNKRFKGSTHPQPSILSNATPVASTGVNVSAQSHEQANPVSRFYYQPANLADSVIRESPQPTANTSTQPQRPNLQNNFYYNFSNNYCGPGSNNQLPDSVGKQVSQVMTSNQGKQVKSIEIQVTPEKLMEVADAKTGQENEEVKGTKKRRRRKRQAEAQADNNDYSMRGPWGGYPPQYYGQIPHYPPNQGPQQSKQQQRQGPYYPNGGAQNPYYMNQHGMNPYMYPYPQHPYPQGIPAGKQNMHSQNFPFQTGYPPNAQMPFQPFPGSQQRPSMPQSPFNGPHDESKSQQEQLKDYLRTMFYPFQNDQLKELILQIEIYIQILYQVLLFKKKSHDPENESSHEKESEKEKVAATKDMIKYRAYCLLYEFQSKKEQTLKPLNLPIYKVPLDLIQSQSPQPHNNDTSDPFVLQINPQVSFYQSPLLEIAPEVIKRFSKMSSQPIQQAQNKASAKFLMRYQPLINPHILPLFPPPIAAPINKKFHNYKQGEGQVKIEAMREEVNEEEEEEPVQPSSNGMNNNRRKFSLVDDNFMLLGLRQYGYKDVDQIRNNWLPNKSANEIKHRYKNLTCAKASMNIIKKWKTTHCIPLNEWEEKQFARAVKWFGPNSTNRWPLITKCFLPNRSPLFLKMEYQVIVQNHARSERFGKLMLSAGDGASDKEERFEDIDLDRLSDEYEDQVIAVTDEAANGEYYIGGNSDAQYEEVEL